MAPVATRDLVSPEPAKIIEGPAKKLATLKVDDINSRRSSRDRAAKAPCCVYDFIQYQVTTQPEAPAVQFSTSESVTYLQLSELTADIVLALDIQPHTIVPVCMEPSVRFIATILAILKAGAAYVILDPHGSLERNRGIVDDCNADVVLVDKDYAPHFEKSVVLDSLSLGKASPKGFLPCDSYGPIQDSDVGADDPAYLVYTSGKDPHFRFFQWAMG